MKKKHALAVGALQRKAENQPAHHCVTREAGNVGGWGLGVVGGGGG